MCVLLIHAMESCHVSPFGRLYPAARFRSWMVLDILLVVNNLSQHRGFVFVALLLSGRKLPVSGFLTAALPRLHAIMSVLNHVAPFHTALKQVHYLFDCACQTTFHFTVHYLVLTAFALFCCGSLTYAFHSRTLLNRKPPSLPDGGVTWQTSTANPEERVMTL